MHTNSYVKKPSDEEKDASISDFEEKKLEQENKTGDVILDNNDLENDDDDMSKVVGDIEKALSNLSQAEVE